MPRDQVLINSQHYKGGSSYVYKLPHPITFTKDSKVSLYSFSMYNSTYNISASLGNNTFSIKWLGNTFLYTIPDGYYSYNDLNNFLQYCMLTNGLYVLKGTSPVYFISLTSNAPQYSAQINITFIPCIDASGNTPQTTYGYTIPQGAGWTFPTYAQGNKTPQLIISSGLQSILGFQGGQNTFPTTVLNTNKNFTSTALPILSPVYCYVLHCNLVQSSYNNVPTVFQQVPINVSYGGLINFINPTPQSINIREGVYSDITIWISDQYYNPVQFKDWELTLALLIDTPEK